MNKIHNVCGVCQLIPLHFGLFKYKTEMSHVVLFKMYLDRGRGTKDCLDDSK